VLRERTFALHRQQPVNV